MQQNRLVALTITAALVGASLTGCSTLAASSATTVVSSTASGLWDSSAVHDISVTIADADYQALIAAYVGSGEKIWVSATVTIDGTTLENVGIKLKGNSSLRGISSDSEPETLPWLIRTDKYVEGQEYDGETEIVVRGNNSETALNEAIALELLGVAGLATQEAISSRFTVNGGETELRLVIQNPDDDWDAAEFGDTGLLYKAEAGGDYSYRGLDPESYTDVFDQEVGDDNLDPLIDFLRFINESDDVTFAAQLGEYLDVDSFARYLAFQSLVDNFDDIDGPGNNSYLHYDEQTGMMTVVNWDLNLAFGVQNGGGPGMQGMQGMQGGQPPQGGQAPQGDPGTARPGGMAGSNILTERFTATPEFQALVDAATLELTDTLFTSGTAQSILDEWVSVLGTQDVVDAATVASDAAAVAKYFGAK